MSQQHQHHHEDESPQQPLTLQQLAEAAAQLESANGIECAKCGCRHFRVVYTRPQPGRIFRLRECRHCGQRRPTTER